MPDALGPRAESGTTSRGLGRVLVALYATLALAAGPFGEELAVLSWADRLAAQGPRLKPEHVERHEALCTRFLRVSRFLGPYPEPDYERLTERLEVEKPVSPADVGYAASRLRLLVARGMDEVRAAALSLPCW